MEMVESAMMFLGGISVFGKKIAEPDDLRHRVQRGLPYRSLEALVKLLGLQADEVEHILNLPARTRARRKKSHTLTTTESDRLYRVARIAALASEALGGHEKAARWLHKPNRTLGDQTPLTLLDTEIGARQVEDVLGRIEHGVFG